MVPGLDTIVGKVTDAVVGLTAKSLKSNDQVVAFLENLGYEDLQNSFQSIYLHALAMRRLDGVRAPC